MPILFQLFLLRTFLCNSFVLFSDIFTQSFLFKMEIFLEKSAQLFNETYAIFFNAISLYTMRWIFFYAMNFSNQVYVLQTNSSDYKWRFTISWRIRCVK